MKTDLAEESSKGSNIDTNINENWEIPKGYQEKGFLPKITAKPEKPYLRCVVRISENTMTTVLRK